MEPLTIYQLRSRASEHFEATRRTPGIDKFCSTLDWTLPSHEAFIPEHPLLLCETAGDGFATLARGFNPRIGRYLQPLEASWCLASPFVAADVPAQIRDFSRAMHSRFRDWDLLYLSGIPMDSVMFRSLVSAFRSNRIGLGHKTRRFRASLEGGLDGFLARRSSKFRANLRRIKRKATQDGFEFDYLSHLTTEAEAEAIYERILAIEEKSWKGKEGTGILDGGMNAFYRIMLPRLARRSALRVLIARRDGEDVAYVFGGTFAGTYRGLQLSYDEDFRNFAPGNLVQLMMIEKLCEEGIDWYDLGSELDYKSRWAEDRLETITLWIWKEL